MKYCVDCRFMYRYLPGDEHPQCRKFTFEERTESPVLGVIVTRAIAWCEQERAPEGRCGSDAKEWQERVPPSHITNKKRWFAF